MQLAEIPISKFVITCRFGDDKIGKLSPMRTKLPWENKW